MLHFRLIALLLATLTILAGCVHKSGPRPEEEARRESSDKNKPFFLVDIAIDQQAVQSGSALLFDEAPSGEQFGERRRARGFVTFTEDRLCSCEVRVAEVVVGLGGQKSEQRYSLLAFYGKVSAGGDIGTPIGGPRDNKSYAGPVSEIRLHWLSESEFEIRPMHAEKQGAYVFRFARKSFTERDVNMPF